MPTFVILLGFTSEGLQKIKASPGLFEEAKQLAQSMGAKVKASYAVMGMGQYDWMFIVEAADDETTGKVALALGSKGGLRTQTYRAFTEEEYQRITAALP